MVPAWRMFRLSVSQSCYYLKQDQNDFYYDCNNIYHRAVLLSLRSVNFFKIGVLVLWHSMVLWFSDSLSFYILQCSPCRHKNITSQMERSGTCIRFNLLCYASAKYFVNIPLISLCSCANQSVMPCISSSIASNSLSCGLWPCPAKRSNTL